MDGHSQQEVGPESLQSIMDMGADSSLEQLDMEQLKKDRFQRNQELMETLSKSVSREIFPQRCHENRYVQAAIMIQKLFRGYLGRKKYVELLYDQYAQEERDIAEKSEAQFVEGELLVENHQLEVLLDDEDTARRNRKRNYLSKVITIQRGWREYLKNKHSSDTDNSDIVEDVESKILHDESEKSQNLKKSDEKGVNSCDEPNCSARNELIDKDDKVDEGKDVNSISVSSSENIGPNIYKQEVNVNNSEINVASESAPLQESNDDLLLSVTKQSGEPTERSEVRTDSSHECAYVDGCESVTSGSVLSDTDKNQVNLPSSLLVQHTEEPDAYSAACSVKAKGGNSKQSSVDLEKAAEKDLSERKSVFLKGDNSICPLLKEEGESEEEYQRRVRKHNFLTIARDFAELKKVNADVLPFDLHLVQSHMMDSCSDSSSAPPSHPSSELTTPITDTPGSLGSISQGSLGSLSHVTDRLDNLAVTDVNSNLPPNNAKNTDQGSHTTPRNISNDNDIPANFRSQNATRHCQGVSSHGTTLRDLGEEGDFDVYNIETTAGANINWESLEKQLQQAEEEQRQRQESQRNDREEIRRKLAMETDEESFPPPSSVNSEGLYRKSQISSRLQGGMNLQICFMNEAPGDEPESPTESPHLDPQPQNTLLDKSEEFTFKPHELKMSAGFQRAMMPSKKDFEDEDFFKKQARLQHEAKIALAQASTMAHMQLEVEKQKKKKSPVADIIGHPLRSYGNKLKFNYRDLLDMNIAQLQVLVNELHSQIENLNEDLVKFLMERDELHMGQDSMLVDIEDLTRRMEDKAKRSKKGFVGRKS